MFSLIKALLRLIESLVQETARREKSIESSHNGYALVQKKGYLVSERKLGFFVEIKAGENFNRRNISELKIH